MNSENLVTDKTDKCNANRFLKKPRVCKLQNYLYIKVSPTSEANNDAVLYWNCLAFLPVFFPHNFMYFSIFVESPLGEISKVSNLSIYLSLLIDFFGSLGGRPGKFYSNRCSICTSLVWRM